MTSDGNCLSSGERGFYWFFSAVAVPNVNVSLVQIRSTISTSEKSNNVKGCALFNLRCPSCDPLSLQCLGSLWIIFHQLLLHINGHAMFFGGTFHEGVEFLNNTREVVWCSCNTHQSQKGPIDLHRNAHKVYLLSALFYKSLHIPVYYRHNSTAIRSLLFYFAAISLLSLCDSWQDLHQLCRSYLCLLRWPWSANHNS